MRPGIHDDHRIAQANAVAEHLARALGEDDFLPDAGLGYVDYRATRRFGRARRIADLCHLLIALDEHQMAELFGNILESRLWQRGREFGPEIGRDRAVNFGWRLRAEPDHAEAALRQALLGY